MFFNIITQILKFRNLMKTEMFEIFEYFEVFTFFENFDHVKYSHQ